MSDNPKSILITSANSGIGQATAEYLASHGFHVYAGTRNTAALKDLYKNQNITPVKLDVTNIENIIQVKKIVEQNAAGLFGLVNNAGITKADPWKDILIPYAGKSSPYGIRVIIIEPRRITTPIWNKGEKILQNEKTTDS